MRNAQSLVQNFVAGRSFKVGLSSRTPYGVLRLSYDDKYFYSYRMKLAYRDPQGNIIINGDMGPTATTRKHQKNFRGIPGAQIPFSVLAHMHINVEDIKVIHANADFYLPRKRLCRGTEDRPCWCTDHETYNGKVYDVIEEHFLGETLFEHGGDLYISGLDRNEPPLKRHFYVARLPTTSSATTVSEGLDDLRPSRVPQNAARQGEWFFVPTEYTTAGRLLKALGIKDTIDNVVTRNAPLDGREGRHVVSQLCLIADRVFAFGVVRDQEHVDLKLPKVWHEVFRNLSRGGFSIDAAHRVRVD